MIETQNNQEIQEPQMIIRLLNGVLKGYEFELGKGKTLFVVGKEEAILKKENEAKLPENTIFIPFDVEEFQFEIEVDSSNKILLREFIHHASKEKTIDFNHIVSVETLNFAIKAINTEWDEAILTGKKKEMAVSKQSKKSFVRHLMTLLISGFVVGLIFFMLAYFKMTDEEKKEKEKTKEISQISYVLGDYQGKYEILGAHDHWMYVFAKNEKEATWAKQSLTRADIKNPIRVINLQDEEKRVAAWLSENWSWVKYHRVKIETPLVPVLLISQERTVLDAQKSLNLMQSLKEQMPYAQEIKIIDISDQEVASQAEAGIQKISVPYIRQDHGNSVTFVIKGALEDGHIQQLRRFVVNYNKAWGQQYVQFSIELKDDWLKGKSLKYGHQGSYVKVSPGYWYFPKP